MPARILVIRPDRIGDVVLATPVIRALRKAFPRAYIAALVRPQTRPVLDNNPHLDAIITDDFAGTDQGRGGFFRKLRELRTHHFDTCLMLLPTERHVWMTFFAGIRTRIGVGFRPYHALTCTRMVSRHKYVPLRHEADYCLDLVRRLGVEADDLACEIHLRPDEYAHGERVLRDAGWDGTAPLVFLNPESGRSSPNWTMERYVELARVLAAHTSSFRVVVPCTEVGDAVERAFTGAAIPGILLPDGGMDLRTLMSCIAHARLVFSASTGPMHIAAALGIPTLSMFCPLPATSTVLWGPQGNHAEFIVAPERACDTICPGDPHECLFEGVIEVSEAASRILELMRTAAGPVPT